jgi:hypothetical protein
MCLKKKEKDWFYDIKPEPKLAEDISESFEKAFNMRTIIIELMDVIFSILVSLIINDPLVALAHYLRTGYWYFYVDFSSFIVFILLLIGIIFISYIISKQIRKAIKEELIENRNRFYTRLISIIFAFLIIDLIVDGLLLVSTAITNLDGMVDFGIIIDKIIASLILLAIFLLIYFIARKRAK